MSQSWPFIFSTCALLYVLVGVWIRRWWHLPISAHLGKPLESVYTTRKQGCINQTSDPKRVVITEMNWSIVFVWHGLEIALWFTIVVFIAFHCSWKSNPVFSRWAADDNLIVLTRRTQLTETYLGLTWENVTGYQLSFPVLQQEVLAQKWKMFVRWAVPLSSITAFCDGTGEYAGWLLPI